MFQNYRINLYKSVNENLLVKVFVATHHYLGKSMPRGCDKWFVFIDSDNVIRGVAAFGIPAGRNCIKKYGEGTLELRRFVLCPSLPKNSGSWFMSKCLSQLKEYNILSYSDPAQGHTGHLYKAANFYHIGLQRQGSSQVKVGDTIMFGQSHKAKKITNKKIVYMPKKDIWFYPARNRKINVAEILKMKTKVLAEMKRTSCVDLETGIIYKSVYAASKETGIDCASIRFHLDKKLVKKQPRFINY